MRIDISTVCGKVKFIVATASKILAICDTYEQAKSKQLSYNII